MPDVEIGIPSIQSSVLRKARDVYNKHIMPVKKNLSRVDQIYISNIRCRCQIGHTAKEREMPQTLLVSIVLYKDLRQAASADRIEATVDYSLVIQEIRNLLESQVFSLIEAAAEKVAFVILQRFSVSKVSIKVTKHPFSDVGGVGIRIEREAGRFDQKGKRKSR